MNSLKYIIPIVLICVVIAVTVPLVVVNRNPTVVEDGGPLVNTNVGPIRGLAVTSPRSDYSMFLGIPYATVNASNPFGPSIPHEGFEDTFEASDDSIICPQVGVAETTGSRIITQVDCLNLHIFVPNGASATNRLPVMVYIYGGGFFSGFAHRYIYDPIFLLAKDVIVVTLNYRVGAYGWLCLDIPEVPGNQGLKDQLTALRWIKNNIEAFGGDTDKITLFGQSAGAMSVDLHYIYSQEDLFNNVILQSGTALSYFSYNASDPTAVLQLAEHLGHATGDVYDALDFLKNVDPSRVAQATAELDLTVKPCVEQEFENVERYITTRPALADVPNAKTKPVMIGFTDNEFGINFLDQGSQHDPLHIIEDFYYFFDRELLPNAVEIVRRFYIGDEDYNEKEEEQRIADFRSDFTFVHPAYRTIKKYLENGAYSIYHYMYSYIGDRSLSRAIQNITVDGALHGEEVAYIFDMVLFPETPTPADELMIDKMTTMWVNFAKHSNPIPETSDILPILWPVVTNESMHCLNIDSELRLHRRAFHDRMAFWDLFYMMFQAIS